MSVLRVNPVLERELRERMRTTGAVVLLTLYLGLMVTVFLLVYNGQSRGSGFTSTIAPTEVARVGRGIFETVLFLMSLLVLFIVPGYTAAAIAGERERQTLVPMQVTLLRPRSIALGKIMASMAYLLLLIVASAPLLALSYLIGGVSLHQAARGLGAIVFVGIALACMTVACSAIAKRVQTATILAYGLTLLLSMGTLIVYTAVAASMSSNATSEARSAGTVDKPPVAIIAGNPFFLISAAIDGSNLSEPLDEGTGATGRTTSPFQSVRETMHPKSNQFNGQDFTAVQAIGPNGVIMPNAPNGANPAAPPPATGFEDFVKWSVVLYAALAVISVLWAAFKLRTPAESER
jgi:ABC-type transport system involved in multi-copper enzyme maturation permease subunit